MLIVEDDGSTNPFPAAIRSNDWVAYHGTSAAYAEKIEAGGLGHGGVPEWFGDARRLSELLDELRYYGRPGGFSTLVFAVSEDDVSSEQKLVYLGEDFRRACVFASVRGGESVNAIRIALDDVQSFVSSPELLRHHHAELVLGSARVGGDPGTMSDTGIREAASVGWHPKSEVLKIHRALSLLESPQELRARVDSFEGLSNLIDRIQEQHAPIIYAVRLTQAELADGRYSDSMGIAVQSVPPEQLLARCLLKSERDPVRWATHEAFETSQLWIRRFSQQGA